MALTRSETRKRSFGEDHKLTAVDRFGIWLSSRQIQRHAGDLAGRRLADVGCGYHATFARTLLPTLGRLVLVDVSLAPELKTLERVEALEGALPEVLAPLAPESLDVIVCNSVIEHLADPLATLVEFRRLLAPGGVALLNVPSWRGKRYLELSAFRLGLSPAEEMDDHKMYYDPPQLWPLLVAAGFRPRMIRCFRHKFGLNTFAVCRKESAGS